MKDPLEHLIGYQLRRTSLLVMADLQAALAGLDLKPTEASVLSVIGANPQCSQSDVGRLLAIKSANMAPLIAGLMKRGLLHRVPLDGRSNALMLNDDGMALLTRVQAAVATHEDRILNRLDDAARQRLSDATRLIRDTLETGAE